MDDQKKPLISNAADEAQVKNAATKFKITRDSEMNDLRFLMSTQQGRRFMWRFLAHCKVFGSVWEPSAKIHYNAGKQDIGHFLQSEIVEADQDMYFKMMTEAKGNE